MTAPTPPTIAQDLGTLTHDLQTRAVSADNNSEMTMRNIVKSRVVPMSSGASQDQDLRWKFLEAHHYFAAKPTLYELAIRFTAQYNLFAGSVMSLGTEAQAASCFADCEENGLLGCFAFTERNAGVLSGFSLTTTATYDPISREFILHTPEGAEKYWISQGCCADYTFVSARLIVGCVDRGSHGFLFRGSPEGVSREQMPEKSALQTLDNAVIKFSHVRLPATSLLSRYTQIDEHGTYSAEQSYSFMKLIERLLSGRLIIASLINRSFQDSLDKIHDHIMQRSVLFTRTTHVFLSDIPHVAESFYKASQECSRTAEFIACVERGFATGEHELTEMQEEVSIAKICAVDSAIKWLGVLRKSLGSYVLLKSSPFAPEKLELLYCSRFAEGDNHMLKQKIVRTAMLQATKHMPNCRADFALLLLAIEMWIFGGHTVASQVTEWQRRYKEVGRCFDLVSQEKMTQPSMYHNMPRSMNTSSKASLRQATKYSTQKVVMRGATAWVLLSESVPMASIKTMVTDIGFISTAHSRTTQGSSTSHVGVYAANRGRMTRDTRPPVTQAATNAPIMLPCIAVPLFLHMFTAATTDATRPPTSTTAPTTRLDKLVGATIQLK
ncbi:pristanoyl-coa/acyl-CoA oxidase [Pelomyxa schiedti]|nr:pristanoyl-coa/acyl-CoA oxidase [Pelomyxa schiedti]